MLTDAKWYSSLAILAVVFDWAIAAAAAVGSMTFNASVVGCDAIVSFA